MLGSADYAHRWIWYVVYNNQQIVKCDGRFFLFRVTVVVPRRFVGETHLLLLVLLLRTGILLRLHTHKHKLRIYRSIPVPTPLATKPRNTLTPFSASIAAARSSALHPGNQRACMRAIYVCVCAYTIHIKKQFSCWNAATALLRRDKQCVIRVTNGDPDDEPMFAPGDKKRNEEVNKKWA